MTMLQALGRLSKPNTFHSIFKATYHHWRGSGEDLKLQGTKYKEEEQLVFVVKQAKNFN